jgi:hypothetical protein
MFTDRHLRVAVAVVVSAGCAWWVYSVFRPARAIPSRPVALPIKPAPAAEVSRSSLPAPSSIDVAVSAGQPATTLSSVTPQPLVNIATVVPMAPWSPAGSSTNTASSPEIVATRRMYGAHASLRTPEVANPDSAANRQILQTMVTKALSRAAQAEPQSSSK